MEGVGVLAPHCANNLYLLQKTLYFPELFVIRGLVLIHRGFHCIVRPRLSECPQRQETGKCKTKR